MLCRRHFDRRSIPPVVGTRAALLIKVILNSLLHRLERAWINLGVLAGKELNGPLIDQFFGGVLFSHSQFRVVGSFEFLVT